VRAGRLKMFFHDLGKQPTDIKLCWNQCSDIKYCFKKFKNCTFVPTFQYSPSSSFALYIFFDEYRNIIVLGSKLLLLNLKSVDHNCYSRRCKCFWKRLLTFGWLIFSFMEEQEFCFITKSRPALGLIQPPMVTRGSFSIV